MSSTPKLRKVDQNWKINFINSNLLFNSKVLRKQQPKRLKLKTLIRIVKNSIDWKFRQVLLNFVFVDEKISRQLNLDFRGKDYATNILTFDMKNDLSSLNAELVICVSVLESEAAEQNKRLSDHLLHLLVHGVLHAQGLDHLNESEALAMENKEIKILENFGIPNPFV